MPSWLLARLETKLENNILQLIQSVLETNLEHKLELLLFMLMKKLVSQLVNLLKLNSLTQQRDIPLMLQEFQDINMFLKMIQNLYLN